MNFKLLLIISLIILEPAISQAQLKRDLPDHSIDNASSMLVASPSMDQGGSLFNTLLDPEHFRMSHSYSLEYNSMMNNTVGEYVNTMRYAFDFPLVLRADIGMMHQPFGASDKQAQYGFGSDAFTGVYLKNASLTYRPFKNLLMGISYQRYNAMGYNPFHPMQSRWREQ
jgi:hypothetical protein